MGSQSIKLKAVIDKEKNRVILAESEGDFIVVLLSFLTMPMGKIIRLTHNQLPSLGCMKNLRASVENLDVRRFGTQACKEMLLHPQSGAATHCKYLKLKIDNTMTEPLSFFYCGNDECVASKHKLSSHYSSSFCDCGESMKYLLYQLPNAESNNIVVSDPRDEGVFVRGLTRLIISDELQLMPPSTTASFSLCAMRGVMDANTTEERTFDIRVNEAITNVLNLLKSTLVSNTPLTDTLLKQKQVTEWKENLGGGLRSFIKQEIGEHATEGSSKICVRLMLSKSKKMIYIMVLRNFILRNTSKSNDQKETLLNPKVASGFGYKNQLLGVGVEAVNQQCYWLRNFPPSIRTHKPAGGTFTTLTMKDPKAPHYKEAISNGGFVLGPETFIVTDDLTVTLSPVSVLSILNKLKVTFSDIEERIVYAGNKEALQLLIASYISESALTDTFTPQKAKTRILKA
ncbi:uncharacterized protein LOC110640622 [Hevea brasiliensis]|uniref:uncharacterized protein LOC110640622 n=1 Tax=Hevea brasiliensis TaxID=3981 RepID=UPI0025FD68B7|nr:uncharacterized protein LOC110640622 [Hevea brasiliensis]